MSNSTHEPDWSEVQWHCSELERAIVPTIAAIRKALGEHNISEMRFDVEARGRTLSGDVNIEFCLGASTYASDSSSGARGGRLYEVVREMVHRYGWSKRNAALCLPAGRTSVEEEREAERTADDEIPF